MDRVGFGDFLRNRGYTDKSVNSRIARVSSVERHFGIDIDVVVKNDQSTYDLLININAAGDRNGTKQNAVRKYYEFRNNNREFPRLRDFI